MRQNAPDNKFPDVAESVWYRDAVSIAEEFGIVRGYTDGSFKGVQTITREEGFAMVARAYYLETERAPLGKEETVAKLAGFGDGESVARWAQADVATLVAAGIIEGNELELLKPKDNMTRAEVAALIARLLKTTELIDK